MSRYKTVSSPSCRSNDFRLFPSQANGRDNVHTSASRGQSYVYVVKFTHFTCVIDTVVIAMFLLARAKSWGIGFRNFLNLRFNRMSDSQTLKRSERLQILLAMVELEAIDDSTASPPVQPRSVNCCAGAWRRGISKNPPTMLKHPNTALWMNRCATKARHSLPAVASAALTALTDRLLLRASFPHDFTTRAI